MNNQRFSNCLDFSHIDWSPHSFEDPGGRIFWKEGRLFRALRGRSAEGFRVLERERLLERLEELNIVKTWRVNCDIPDYEIIVEHEVLPPGPIVSEWSPSMLFDAAILYCNLSDTLAKHELQLQDSHGWNIMFHHGRPVYVDFSSIVPLTLTEEWMPLYEFINCFLHPLQLIAQQQVDYAFYLLGTKNWVSVNNSTPFLFMPQYIIMKRSKERKYKQWEQIRKTRGPQSAKRLVGILKQEVEKSRPSTMATRWSDYASGFPVPSEVTKETWNEKQKSVHKILSGLKTGRILDLGCNTGWYSILAAQMGFDVISMDTDRIAIDKLYKEIKRQNLSVTPVVASPFWPIISHGPRFYESLANRFRSDHTLVLALVHHLFFKQGYDVKSIVEIVSAMTDKSVILEYIPAEDYWIKQWGVHHRVKEYEIEVWIAELKAKFPCVNILPSEHSHPSSNVQRVLIFAQC